MLVKILKFVLSLMTIICIFIVMHTYRISLTRGGSFNEVVFWCFMVGFNFMAYLSLKIEEIIDILRKSK